MKKLLQKWGDWLYIIIAGIVVLLLVMWQPLVKKKNTGVATNAPTGFDKERELVEVRADKFISLLQEAARRNSGAFNVNAADTNGKAIRIQLQDGGQAAGIFYNERVPDAGWVGQLRKYDIKLSDSEISLPLRRKDKILLVNVPSLMMYSLGKQQ